MDGDGLINGDEIKLGISPTLTDTNEDGLSDYDEIKSIKPIRCHYIHIKGGITPYWLYHPLIFLLQIK